MDTRRPTDTPGAHLGRGRYVLKRPLGAGAMGQVYIALDTELGHDVALKMLHGRNADELYYLKHEFRILAGLRHPNLVALYDLVVESEHPFFTMELLLGVDLVSHVRGSKYIGMPGPPGPGGWKRLRTALPQLLAGLGALHATGRLHCDIKPSNVLVTVEGRVVLIDFGLATLPALTAHSDEGTLAGTVSYMAPELLRGEPPTVASDCYALGVTLFEALTAELPFNQRTLGEILRHGKGRPGPLLRDRVPETPSDLDALVAALLQEDPAERPNHSVIRSMLRAEAEYAQPALVPSAASLWEAPFVGRTESLAALHRALRDVSAGAPVTVRIEGPSGIGKSALVRHFLKQTEDQPTLVLAGRCHPQESVPFKALDGLVDGLSESLCNLEVPELGDLSPDSAGALLRVFPVLGRSPALASVVTADVISSELQEVRRVAFATLLELLRRLTERQRLILWIDDLQWGDADSAVFLRMLAHSRQAPAVLLLLSYRAAGWEATAVAEALKTDGGAPIGRTLALAPLPADEACSLVAGVLAGKSPTGTVDVDAIARESDGNPFLLCELVRYCAARSRPRPGPGVGAERPVESSDRAIAAIPVGITEIVQNRLRSLDGGARRLLSAIALVGGPCRQTVAGQAASLGHGITKAVATLRNECLVRDSVAGKDLRIETFHDRIREAIVHLLGDDERRGLHLGLAEALEGEPDTDPVLLVQHYHGAGDDERAARTATVAAERAYAALAFEQAARLYEFTLSVGADDSQRWRLLRGRAGALAQAGRGSEAGRAYREAARVLAEREPSSPRVQELTRLAAEQLLRSGYIEDGTTVLREVLRAVGEPYPTTPGRAVLDFVQHRALLMLRGLRYRPRAEEHVAPATLRRIDALWAGAMGLVWADSIRSAAFHGRHTRLALTAGEPTRVVRALCSEAVYHAAIASRWAQRRGAHALAAAEALSSELDTPFAIGLTAVCAGGSAYFAGWFPDGYSHSIRAEKILRTQCSGVAWELTNAHIYTSWSLAHMGDLTRLREIIPDLLRRARERDDLLDYCCLLAGIPTSMRLLADDEPREVQAAVREAAASWPTAHFQLPSYFGLVSATLADLYGGHPVLAWQRMSDAWPTVRAAGLLHFRLVRVEFQQLLARCAIAALANDRSLAASARRAMRRLVVRSIRRIAREDMPWAAPLAAALSASIAAARNNRTSTEYSLHRAADGFAGAAMGLWAAVARHQAGLPEGTRWMRDQGIKDPDRYAEMLIPIRTVTGESRGTLAP